ncbi:hypothetical protein KJ819_00435 [Patescibacteria group bacterium]|nr:hypothetical protein [Patescibacteria group bacterium]MBU1501103.1 hypothetical protein [Patescibacteria group bacterium]MBU2081024.1 hypothetical protein [Patescibacteria group bacterium]MBU2124115.1 hypothetical protein [Patescibacteria group bacterium]MBU2194971.1 hypothetical protein [Patescibacteria group bacterium]
MAIIIPAIIPTSKEHLEESLLKLKGLCSEVQVDVVDGTFASPLSWPYGTKDLTAMHDEGEMLPGCGEFSFEIDLMSADPETDTGPWITVGATRVTVHAESTPYLNRFFKNIRGEYGHDKDFVSDLLSIGLAVGIETDTALLEPYLEDVEYVQFMGIRSIGKQGQGFDSRVLPKIRAFKKKYPNIPIQVDGGVSLTTAPGLLEAGASRLVVGSALWNSADLKEELEKFISLTERHGIYG